MKTFERLPLCYCDALQWMLFGYALLAVLPTPLRPLEAVKALCFAENSSFVSCIFHRSVWQEIVSSKLLVHSMKPTLPDKFGVSMLVAIKLHNELDLAALRMDELQALHGVARVAPRGADLRRWRLTRPALWLEFHQGLPSKRRKAETSLRCRFMMRTRCFRSSRCAHVLLRGRSHLTWCIASRIVGEWSRC